MSTLEPSRNAYKGQLTRVKNVVLKYQANPELLEDEKAEIELRTQREMIPSIEKKFQAIQLQIIKETPIALRPKEEDEMLKFLDDTANTEHEISQLLATIAVKTHAEENAAASANLSGTGGDDVSQLVAIIRQQMKENRQQRLSDQANLKEILEAQKDEIQQLLQAPNRRDSLLNSTTFGHDECFQARVKLENIKLPTFTGSYAEWPTFKNLFMSMVDKNPFHTKAQKMWYLVTYVKGEAFALFSSLPLSDDNYQVAWSRLEKRYDDKMIIIRTHMENFLNQEQITKPDVTALRKLQSVTCQALEAIDALEVTARDPWLIHLTVRHLDRQTQTLWSEKKPEGVPTWKNFDDFLNTRCRNLESCPAPVQQPRSKSNTKVSTCVVSNKRKEVCQYCKINSHRLYKCRKFLGLPPKQRVEVVSSLRLCQNCLIDSHEIESCNYQSCKECSQRHNHLLHIAPSNSVSQTVAHGKAQEKKKDSFPPAQIDKPSTSTATLSCSGASGGVKSNVLFATAIVKLLGSNNNPQYCRVVLDPASQINIITTHMCQRLHLCPKRTNYVVDGVGSISQASQQEVEVRMQYQSGHEIFTENVNCIVMQKVVGDQPNWDIDITKVPLPPHIKLADPTWHVRQKIDLLIGGGLAWQYLGCERQSLGEGLPMLQQSVFGWLVVGPCYGAHKEVAACGITTLASIDRTLKKFWEIEDIPRKPIAEIEHQEVEDNFRLTTVRTPEGRYVVQLPVRPEIQDLANNKLVATRQLNYLLPRLQKNPKLYQDYSNTFKEYLSLKMIERVSPEEVQNPSYYLPHHAVVKENAVSTKTRVVFNASSQSKSGLSLNDCLKSCPVVQPTLISTLWRFRLGEIALTCDIVKMYLQVALFPPHKDFHRFVWKEEGKLVDFRFTRVCFGVAASPYLATRVLNQIADDEGHKFPLAAPVLRQCFYVDDCLYSASTVDEVLEVKQQLIDLLKTAGMELSKFRANRQEIIDAKEGDETGSAALILDQESKTLGIIWVPRIDVFQFRVANDLHSLSATRRTVLSVIARIFDPCGLISPVVVVGKMILQSTWTKSIEWDTGLPEDLLREWNIFITDLPNLDKLSIPRWISTISSPCRRELHAFCDASILAYGAAIYVIYEDIEGNRSSRLLTAKSRVAPKSKDDNTRLLTIPKAELSAAELGAQLMDVVGRSLEIENKYFWTDATVVLYQIHARTPHRELFVKNRVSSILKTSTRQQWRHVPTAQNPADVLSRGTTAQKLISNSLWWQGPGWLVKPNSDWPPEFSSMAQVTSNKDMEPHPQTLACTDSHEMEYDNPLHEYFLEKHSSFLKATRVLGWTRRAVAMFKARKQGRVTRSVTRSTPYLPFLQVSELKAAEKILIKWEQEQHLSRPILHLECNQRNRISKPIRKLYPFLDQDGLLRVGGRIGLSENSYDARHPIILPRGKLAYLIAREEHARLLHPGPQQALSSLRQKYWAINGRNLVRKVVRECVKCIRAKPAASEQLMGTLPECRVNLARPFLHTGVDLTGHVMIKRTPRGSTQEKAYVCIFVCMGSKAVHLELITSLSSQAFISAFRRFIARRGMPCHMYSDNGTNFVGGSKDLKQLLDDHKVQQELADMSSRLSIQWHFNPPSAPHQGGLWEAAVRSFKHHFKRVIGATILTYEELNTVVIQIEAVLNSRPLIAVHDHPGDNLCLTPGDFLIGGAPTQLPVEDGWIEVDHPRRWQMCTKMRNDFLTRWKKEYVHTLQQRHRWNKESPNISPGDVVLLKSEINTNVDWPMGLVEKVFPGADGKVRVALVRVNFKSILRPITKLVKLPTKAD